MSSSTLSEEANQLSKTDFALGICIRLCELSHNSRLQNQRLG